MSSKRWFVSWTEVRVPKLVEAAAFWGAIALPFVYLPLLFAGLNSTATRLLFASLVTLNAVLIVLGHQYNN